MNNMQGLIMKNFEQARMIIIRVYMCQFYFGGKIDAVLS